jgi:hypothetical protein
MKLTKTKTTKEEYLLQKKCELLHFSSFSLPKQNKISVRNHRRKAVQSYISSLSPIHHEAIFLPNFLKLFQTQTLNTLPEV